MSYVNHINSLDEWYCIHKKQHWNVNLRDKSFVSWLGLQFISVVMTGVAVGAGGSGAKSMYVRGTPITTFPFWKF